MKELRTFVLVWFASVGIITLAIVPIRLYVLSADDWLIGVLSTLALIFFVMYFLISSVWKPNAVQNPKT